MKLNGGDVDVSAGAGESNGTFLPLVRVRAVDFDGGSVELHMTPSNARQIGLDLIQAASNAWADAAVRIYGQKHKIDADTIIGQMKLLADIALRAEMGREEEDEPEAPPPDPSARTH